MSLDRGTGPSTGGRGGQRVASNLTQVLEDDQDAGQRSSVNFSRPMSPASAAKSGWFGGPVVNQDAVQRMASTSRPATSSGVAGAGVRNAQQSVQNAADRPVKTHQISQGVQGSRLSSGSMRSKPSGTAVESRSYLQPTQRAPSAPVDPKSPDAVFDPSTRTFVHKQDAMARHRELNEEPEQPVRHYVAQHVEEHSTPRVAQQQQHHQPAPRTPSPVRRPAQREVSPAAQLPRIDTSARIRRPEDPPTGIPKHDPQSASTDERPKSGHFEDTNVQPEKHVDTIHKPEDNVQPTHIDVMVSPKLALNQDSSYPRLPKPAVATTTNTLAREGKGSVRAANDRGQSLSPPRNAHFAPVAVELAGIKHQPPPRSISPAKSALKSSPSVSRRSNSPVAQNGRLLSQGAPSEASDTTSDGGSKKRRSIRVSFEETPIVAGTSAYADSETPISPSGLAASKWSPSTEKDNEFDDFMKPRPALPSFGSIRDKERRSAHDEVPEKVTETVSSTPMSASVGSVGEPLQSSNDHAIAGIVAQDLATKHASLNDPLPPEVTSVEGSGYVSDSSSEDDGGSDLQKHGSLDDSSQILPVPEPKSLTTPHEEKPTTPSSIKEQVIQVPNIALLPATPSPTEKPEPKFQSMTIPGGWDDDVVEPRKAEVSSAAAKPLEPAEPVHHPSNLHELIARDEESSDDNSSIYSDAYEDLSDVEGGFGSIDAMVESPVKTSPTGLMFSKFADKTTNEPTSSGLRNETHVDDEPELETAPAQTWDATRQHWNDLHEARKQPRADDSSADEAQRRSGVAARVTAAPVKREQPKAEPRVDSSVQSKPIAPKSQTSQPASKPLKSAMKKTTPAQSTPAVQAQPQIRKTMRDQNPQDTRTSQPQMRTSMRGPPNLDLRATDAPIQMRRSMRGGNPPREQPQMRSSMRGSNPSAASNTGLAASRHSMMPVEQKPARAALQKKHIPPAAVAAKSRPQSMPVAPTKPVASVPTYDSDSDASASSFQRARGRRNNNQGERYTMRASMRQAPAPTMRANAPAPKAIRSISPPGSPTPALRKSMRPSSPNPDPPKSSKFSIRSLSPMGRFRSSKPIEAAPPSPTQPKKKGGLSKQPKTKAPTTERAKPAFKSRFADSSDEDEDSRPSRFQSRFADSDDDEPADYTLPPGLAPVRGIPRKAGEEDGDSTDLEEEVDDAPVPLAAQKEMGAGPQTNGASNGLSNGNAAGQGASLTTGTLRDSKHAPLPSFEGGGKSKTKRGFFGLGKKKSVAKPENTAQAATTTNDATQSTTAPPSEIPLPPQQRNRDQGLPLTPIDEDKDIGTPVQNSPQTKRSPKLQRRSTPEWPLPHNNIPVPPIPEDARPMSSDGITPRRPRFQVRQSSQISTATAPIGDTSGGDTSGGDTSGLGRSVSYGRSGKKKKFQGLRRVFGLND